MGSLSNMPLIEYDTQHAPAGVSQLMAVGDEGSSSVAETVTKSLVWAGVASLLGGSTKVVRTVAILRLGLGIVLDR